MRRDLFFLKNYFDLDEFLAAENAGGAGLENILGVGLYSANKAKQPATGIEISVSPPHLKARILDLVTKGFFSPLDEPLFFVGGSEANVKMPWYLSADAQTKGYPALSRWLLIGLLPKFLQSNVSWDEALREALRNAFAKVLEMRPPAVVFLADTELIASFMQSYGVKVAAPNLRSEILHWFVEDNVHPRTAILCRSEDEFEDLVAESRTILKSTDAVQFHL